MLGFQVLKKQFQLSGISAQLSAAIKLFRTNGENCMLEA
jgi:hypothetical protein